MEFVQVIPALSLSIGRATEPHPLQRQPSLLHCSRLDISQELCKSLILGIPTVWSSIWAYFHRESGPDLQRGQSFSFIRDHFQHTSMICMYIRMIWIWPERLNLDLWRFNHLMLLFLGMWVIRDTGVVLLPLIAGNHEPRWPVAMAMRWSFSKYI